MDDFFTGTQTELNEALAAEFASMMDQIPGQTVIGAAVAKPDVSSRVDDHYKQLDLDSDEDWEGWMNDIRTLLTTALGSEPVRAVFAERGFTPFLVTCETDADNEAVVDLFRTLNADPPDQELFQRGVDYWTQR